MNYFLTQAVSYIFSLAFSIFLLLLKHYSIVKHFKEGFGEKKTRTLAHM